MISLQNLGMYLGARKLFDGVNLNLNYGSRYGLIGANGAGKSTLLRILAGEEKPSKGAVALAKQAKIGCLKQDQFRYDNDTILSVVLRGREALWEALSEKEELLSKESFSDADGYRLADLEEVIAQCDGYTAEGAAQAMLTGLGIDETYHHKPLHCLSGGYKLRVLLARTLFDSPQILLLDEPTNFLDIVTINWLEEYLVREFKGLLILVSHDYDFLNNVSTHILDIDYGEVRLYTGNCERFAFLKQEVDDQMHHQKKHIERQVEQTQQFIDRFKAKAHKARQCASREKMLEKIELPEIKNTTRIAPNLLFAVGQPSGIKVVQAREVSKQMGHKRLFEDLDLTIHKGERVAVIGPNGAGKSTLLKIVMGLIAPDQGAIEWGHAAIFSYFAQEHREVVHGSANVFDWLYEQMPEAGEMRVRQVLGNALFCKDDVYKSLTSLSGGEMARLLLARLMLQRRNVLILDEPTNHLDLETRQALADALKEYPGTLLFVSHDRHFVAQLSTRVIALSNGSLHDFDGTYAEFISFGGIDYLQKTGARVAS